MNKVDSVKALDYAYKRIFSNSYNILNTVFEIIAQSKNPKEIIYFEQAIEKAQGYKKLAIYSNFGGYLAYMNEKVMENYIDKFEAMTSSTEEADNYCSKTALRMLKSELVKRDDIQSKKNVDRIDVILDKAKKIDEEF
mgnify:CR=1 FL=1